MLTEPWRIQLLGGLVAKQRDIRIEHFRTRKVATLLAYLALHNCVPTSREVLAEMLWQEEDVETSRNRLRVALASLRKQLEPPPMESGAVLIANRLQVWLREGQVCTDVDQFRRMAAAAAQIEEDNSRAAAMRKALDIYHGELLPGFYEDWVDGERRALEHLYHQFAAGEIDLLFDLGKPAEALPYALRLAAYDPLDEQAQCRLIRVYASIGQSGRAIQVFETLRIRLREDLGLAPSRATSDMVAALRNCSISSAVPLSTFSGQLPSAAETAAATNLVSLRPVELPAAVSSFHGRKNDLQRLQLLIAPNPSQVDPGYDSGRGRLLTLTGLGGIGKTRLGLRAAMQSASKFPGGAWFVALADVEDGDLVAQAIADALRIRLIPHRDILDQLVDELRARTAAGGALLLLDNYEQLVGKGGAAIEALLARVPALCVVTTSRRLLGLTGEREFRVEPLPVPEPDPSVEQVIKSASVDLFRARAQAALPDFQITSRNAADVAELCHKLEGIPLSIELAAARIRLLTPAQMIAEMDQRFDLLVNRRATKDSRHRSLRAAIERSVQMLPIAVREFFMLLSAFRGSWNIEAARFVTGCTDALDKLDDLAAYSLIHTRACEGEMRYSMLETIREYSAGLIPLDNQRPLYAQHAQYYAGWTQECDRITLGSESVRMCAKYEFEKENIRAAWIWALQHDVECAMNIAANLRWIFFILHRLREGEEMLLRSLDAGSYLHPDTVGHALVSLGALRCYMDDFAGAAEPLRKALDLLSPIQLRERTLATAFCGWITMHEGDFDRAHTVLDGARQVFSEIGETWHTAGCLNLMGFAACYAGRLTQARTIFEDSREQFINIGDPAAAAHSTLGVGRAAWMEGNLDDAEQHYRSALAEFLLYDDRRATAYAIEGLARIASNRGGHFAAMRLAGASQRVRDQIALRRDPMDQAAFEAMEQAARVALDDTTHKSAWDAGYLLGEDVVDHP